MASTTYDDYTADYACQTYEATAPFYDFLTAHHDYELWLNNLLPALRDQGLIVGHLLDIGCGTGKSFLPMIERGWRVTAVDQSQAMLTHARAKAAGQALLLRHDMRLLPRLGSFDLAWCLDDAINYLADEHELRATFAAAAANLADHGLYLFDVNTLAMYRGFFSEAHEMPWPQGLLSWRGKASPYFEPGGWAHAVLEARVASGDLIARTTHRQRHFPRAQIEAALGAAGLRVLAVFGHGYDAILEQPLDEGRHTKAVYIAKREGR